MAFYANKTANVKYKDGIMYFTGKMKITQQNVYLTSGNFSKGAANVNPNRIISASPSAPTGSPGTSYTGVTSTPVPNYLIGNAFSLTTYTFSVTNGTGATAYTNGTYTVSASSVTSGFGHQIVNLFNGSNGGGYQEWQSAANYNGATVSNCTVYTGTVSTVASGTTYLGEWCQIQLPYSISITSFKYFTFNNNYGRMSFVGSNDGTNWTKIYVEATNIFNGGAPSGNGVYTTISTVQPYFSYIRFIALVGQNECANPCNLILRGNINIGNEIVGTIDSAYYGTVNSTSVTINLTGTYTSFNIIRTNITTGNIVTTYYGLTGSSYTDRTASPSTNYSYSIVPINFTLIGTAYSVGSTRTMISAPVIAASTKTNYTAAFTFTPISGSDIIYTASTTTGFTGTSTSSPIIIYNLSKNTSYTVTVTATDSFGTSSPSNSITVTTTNVVPTVVTTKSLISATNNSATISFGTTANSQSFTVYTTVGGFSASGTYSPIILNGLSSATTYSVYIVASNDVGNSSNSGIVTIYTKPNPPTNLLLSSDPLGETFAIIKFTPSTGTITNYTVTLNTGAIVTTTTTSASFYGLLPNTSYYVTIVANSTTNYGNSVPSDPLTFTTSDIYVYNGTLSTLDGWINKGGTIVNSSIALTRSGTSYCYMDIGVSLLGKTIQFNGKHSALGEFYFMCNSSGLGNTLRIGSSDLGVGSGYSWTGWSGAIQHYSGTNANIFYTYKLVISNTGSYTLYINNVLKTVTSGTYTLVNNGTYIGFQGDGGDSGAYDYYSNLTIT